MPAKRERSRVDPSAAKGIGFPFPIRLGRSGTLAVANVISAWKVPGFLSAVNILVRGKQGPVRYVLAGVSVFLGSTGTTSGSTTVRVNVVTTRYGTISKTVSVAYNASTGYTSIDFRDVAGEGIALDENDSITVDVTAIPGGSDSANLEVQLIGTAFGVAA